jgi:hypothetical protein
MNDYDTMSMKPSWNIPRDIRQEIKGGGVWEDSSWFPIEFSAQSDVEVDGRLLPISWQIEFEPANELFQHANSRLESAGFATDGYGWSDYITNHFGLVSPKHVEALCFADCEASTFVAWSESRNAAKALVEFVWQLLGDEISKAVPKRHNDRPRGETAEELCLQVSVATISYRMWGSHRALSGAWLAPMSGPTVRFGNAISEIQLYARLVARNGPVNGLESLHDRFVASMADYPIISFSRKKRLVEITYNSSLGSEEELLGEPPVPLTPVLLERGCREILQALNLLRGKIKRTDDFDIDRFLSYAESRLLTLPRNDQEVNDLFDRYAEFSKQWLTP